MRDIVILFIEVLKDYNTRTLSHLLDAVEADVWADLLDEVLGQVEHGEAEQGRSPPGHHHQAVTPQHQHLQQPIRS